MADFTVRSDSVNVEQIMEQIRARIREKRGVDYTEQQIRELANVKLEKFLDPRGVRSDLLDEFRRTRPSGDAAQLPNYAFDEQTIFETHRAPIRWIRRLLRPILKLFFNPNPLIQALHIQSRLNTLHVEAENARRARDQLVFEVIHNLVVEATRLGIEVKNLKMRAESLASRLEFNERRARALESVVAYKPSAQQDVEADRGAAPRADIRDGRFKPEITSLSTASGPLATPVPTPGNQPGALGPGQRSRRRRRRRGRRGGGSAAAMMGQGQPSASVPAPAGAGAAATMNDAAAREAIEPHAATAESIGQSAATEAHPAEGHTNRDRNASDTSEQ
jgi:hypothetical protein